jgi:hypothetical protein
MEHLSGSSVAAAALSSAGGSGSGSGSGAPVVLSDSLSAALAPDVEYHLREVVQDAAKFMRRAKRDTLRAEDVNAALRARRCPELLGYAGSGGSVEPVVCSVGDDDMGDGDVGGRAGTAAAGGEAAVRSVHLLRDRVLDFGELLRAPLPKCPVAPSFTAHWLAVDGAQPRVPQNPQPGSSAADGSSSSSSSSAAADTSFSASAKRKRGEQGGEHGAVAGNEQGDGADGGGGGGVLTKRLVKHVLSRELQAYFSLVAQAVRRGGGGAGGHGARGRWPRRRRRRRSRHAACFARCGATPRCRSSHRTSVASSSRRWRAARARARSARCGRCCGSRSACCRTHTCAWSSTWIRY